MKDDDSKMNDDLYYDNHYLDDDNRDNEPSDYDYDSKYLHNPGFNPLMNPTTARERFIAAGGFIVGDKWYDTKLEAAKDNNIPYATMLNRLLCCWSPQKAATTPLVTPQETKKQYEIYYKNERRRFVAYKNHATPVMYNGKTFCSIKEFCEAYDLPYSNFMYYYRQRCEKNIYKTIEKLKSLGYVKDNENPVTIVAEDGISEVIACGEKIYNNEDALNPGHHVKRRAPYQFEGKEYKSLRALAAALGIPYGTFYHKINHDGLSIEDAVNYCLQIPRRKVAGKHINCFNVEYESITQLAREYNISLSTLSRRLSKGQTPEEAVSSVRRDGRVNGWNKIDQNSTRIYAFNGVFGSLSELAVMYGLNWEDLFDQMAHHQLNPQESVIKLIKKQGVEEYLEKQKNRHDD